MTLKYKIVGLLVFAAALYVGILYYQETDENLEVARAIYAKQNGLPLKSKIAEDTISSVLAGLPQKVRAARELSLEAYNTEVFRAYCALSTVNKTKVDGILLELMDVLIENDDAKMLIEFMEIANYSEDVMLRIFKCAGSEKIMAYFNQKFGLDMFKKGEYKKIGYGIVRLNFDMRGRSVRDAENAFLYAGIDLGMPWSVGEKNYAAYGYPAMAFVAKQKGATEKYEYFRSKSISDIQIERMQGGLFEYIQYSAKAFAMMDEPEVSLALIDKLPEGKRKNLVIKRTIRYILSAKKGRESLDKSAIGRKLEMGNRK